MEIAMAAGMQAKAAAEATRDQVLRAGSEIYGEAAVMEIDDDDDDDEASLPVLDGEGVMGKNDLRIQLRFSGNHQPRSLC